MIESLPFNTILTLVFYVTLLLYVVFSTVLYYHFSNYATDATGTKITYALYFTLTLPLIAIMGVVVLII